MVVERESQAPFTVTDARLKTLAGVAAFMAGQELYQTGCVEFLDATDTTISARVRPIDGVSAGAGAQDAADTAASEDVFTVRLFIARRLQGECTCPSSGGIDFCDHCVAAALALADRDQKLREGSKEERLRAYLQSLSRDKLEAELLLTARSDDGLRERLLQRAEFATQGVTARRLRKELTATTRPKDIWQHQQVQDFFRKIDVAIDNLDAVAGDVPAQVMLEVCGYGFDRIERALERVDDSAGARFDTIRKLKQLHEQSLASVDWSNAQVIAHLAHVLLDQSCFDAAEVLALANARCGEAGEEALFASAQQAFDKLPTLAGEHSFDSAEPYRALTALLTIRAQRLGDVDAEIAMNEKWRSDWTGVRDRAELVLRAGDAERAQALLNDANRLLGRACDARLQVEVHLALGQSQAAVAVLLEQFRDKPRLATYDLLIDAARAADIENATVAEVESMLWAGLREHGAWMRESYAMTLGQLLIRREEFVRCVDVARHHVNHPGLLSELGEMMTAAAPACAVELFGRGVEAHVASQSRAGYRAGVNLANRMYRSLAGRADTELATWRARFDARHYRKTGLVALMGQMDERRAKGD